MLCLSGFELYSRWVSLWCDLSIMVEWCDRMIATFSATYNYKFNSFTTVPTKFTRVERLLCPLKFNHWNWRTHQKFEYSMVLIILNLSGTNLVQVAKPWRFCFNLLIMLLSCWLNLLPGWCFMEKCFAFKCALDRKQTDFLFRSKQWLLIVFL